MKMKKMLVLVLTLALIVSSMAACVKEDSESSSAKKNETVSDEKKTTENDDKDSSAETEISGDESSVEESGESETTGGETESNDSTSSESIAGETTPDGSVIETTKENTTTKPAETTTKKPAATTEPTTTKKPAATTTQETTTKKPAATTTTPTTTKQQSSTTTNYGPIINPLSEDNLEKYSRRGISDAAKSAAVTVLNSILKTSMTEVERVKAIHDWMVKNINYNYDAAANIQGGGTANESALTAEGALVGKNVVCEGYSEAFFLLCWTAGIDARILTGVADNGSGSGPIGHEWNIVNIGGKWYQVDVTWDDPALNGVQNDPTGANLCYQYFLITTADMTKDHTIEEYYGFDAISCTSKDFYTTVDTWAIKKLIGNTPYTKITSYAEGNTASQNYFKQGITEFALIYSEDSLDYQTIMNNAKTEFGTYMQAAIKAGTVEKPAGATGYGWKTNVSCKDDRGYSVTTITITLTWNY